MSVSKTSAVWRTNSCGGVAAASLIACARRAESRSVQVKSSCTQRTDAWMALTALVRTLMDSKAARPLRRRESATPGRRYCRGSQVPPRGATPSTTSKTSSVCSPSSSSAPPLFARRRKAKAKGVEALLELQCVASSSRCRPESSSRAPGSASATLSSVRGALQW